MKTNFYKENFALKTCFEEGADMNSEMAYCNIGLGHPRLFLLEILRAVPGTLPVALFPI